MTRMPDVERDGFATCKLNGISRTSRTSFARLHFSLLLIAPIELFVLLVIASCQTNAQEASKSSPERPTSNSAISDTPGHLAMLPLAERGELLTRLEGKTLSREDIRESALNFSTLAEDARQSIEMAEYLALVFEVAQKRGLLDPELTRYFGRLFAGDSFSPEGNGFGKNSRTYFEKCRSIASPEQKQALEDGLRLSFEEHIATTPICSPRESVQKLVKALTNWGDERYAKSADCFFAPEYASSWSLAVRHLEVLFLLKSREVSPIANAISQHMVADWLNSPSDKRDLTALKPSQLSAEDEANLRYFLAEIGNRNILKDLGEQSLRPENRQRNGVISSPPIIYAHQFRNLVLKEIRRGFLLDRRQQDFVETELNKNEAELTEMLRQFQAEEDTTDGLSGYNTYAVATTVLTSREPSLALKAMRAVSDQEYVPYYVDSTYKSSPRSAAGRTVPFRLAEVAHACTPDEIKLARGKLAKAAINYMDFLPDLVYHARGRYWHRGDDSLAPYFFHPTVPYQASALRMLANDPGLSEIERAHFKYLKVRLQQALIASQKADGTFMLPDIVGDPTAKKEENGGYYSSPAWVNPLAGLAILSLIDDAKELHTQFGILNPESFIKK